PKWAQDLVRAAKSRNRLRGSTQDYSMDDLCAAWKDCDGKCKVSGLEFNFQVHGNGQARRPFAPSLDRIRPDHPYSRENVRLVLSIATFAMNAWGLEPLEVLATGVHNMKGEQLQDAKRSPKDA